MHFQINSTLKNNCNHTPKRARVQVSIWKTKSKCFFFLEIKKKMNIENT